MSTLAPQARAQVGQRWADLSLFDRHEPIEISAQTDEIIVVSVDRRLAEHKIQKNIADFHNGRSRSPATLRQRARSRFSSTMSGPKAKKPVCKSRLGSGSRRTMREALNVIAAVLTEGKREAENLPWAALRYQHTAAIRAALIEKYKPSTTNKTIAALRGVLKECWRLGYMRQKTITGQQTFQQSRRIHCREVGPWLSARSLR